MTITADQALFYMLATGALLLAGVVSLPRAKATTAEHYGWLAIAAGIAHPLATLVAALGGLDGDLTPFLAFELLAAATLAAAAAGRAPGGRAFLPLALLAALLLSLAVQLAPARGPGASGPLLAAVLMAVVLAAAGAECVRHARLRRSSTAPLAVLAAGCGLAVLLWLAVALLQASALAVPQAALALPWLTLKLVIGAGLLQLIASQRKDDEQRLQRALVDAANDAARDLRIAAQAFYQLPARALVADAGGRVLFATAEARRLLGFTEVTGRTLEQLFFAVQPTGHQQLRAVFERPDHVAQLAQVRMGAVDCGGEPCHLLQLEVLPFDFSALRQLLVDARNDAPHEASGLLDQHYTIAAMANGWFRLMEPLDRYAGSGVFWDKLRLLSADEAEISHLEAAIAGAAEASGWLHLRHGGALSVTLRRLLTPERKPFCTVQISLIDEQRAADAAAPCNTETGGLP